MRWRCAAVMLLLLVGCGTSSRVVRLDTGQERPSVFTPHSSSTPVELGDDEFKRAAATLSREAMPSPRPRQAARQLFAMGPQNGAYAYESRSRRLVPLGSREHLRGEPTQEEAELTRDYLGWCERTGRSGDCLHLLIESPTVTGDGRFALALALGKGVVLDEMLESFKGMADPHAMVSAVLWTWTTYMLLLSVPEPFSKGVAAVMTATLISYVGVGTFWGLIVGFRQLMDEADRATTFSKLRTAGERYGKVMGGNAARAFALLAMAAIGNTAPGLATQVPKLPGAPQAALQAETQLGIQLAAVGEMATVAVSAETLTIALAPGAVAMTSSSTSGGSAPQKDDHPELQRWHEGSYDSPLDSLHEHFAKHGAEVGAKDTAQYLLKARSFAQNLKGAQKFPIKGVTEGVVRYVKNGKYVDLAPDGRIVSFGVR